MAVFNIYIVQLSHVIMNSDQQRNLLHHHTSAFIKMICSSKIRADDEKEAGKIK